MSNSLVKNDKNNLIQKFKIKKLNNNNIYSEKSTQISRFTTNNTINDIKNTENEIIFNPQTNNSSVCSIENKNKNGLIFQSHFIEKKRNRKKLKKPSIKKKKRKKGTRSNELDDIRNNIKNKLFDFIIDFFNVIVEKMNLFKHEEFLKINSVYKKEITKKKLNTQMNTSMKEILQFNILDKYKKYNHSHNKNLYFDIKNQIDVKYKYLFDMPLYEFYDKFFLIEDLNELNDKFGYINKKYPLKNIIPQLKKKDQIYKERYKDTAHQLLNFANINIRKNNENNFEKINLLKNNHYDNNVENQNIDDSNSISSIYEIPLNLDSNFNFLFNKEMKNQ